MLSVPLEVPIFQFVVVIFSTLISSYDRHTKETPVNRLSSSSRVSPCPLSDERWVSSLYLKYRDIGGSVYEVTVTHGKVPSTPFTMDTKSPTTKVSYFKFIKVNFNMLSTITSSWNGV